MRKLLILVSIAFALHGSAVRACSCYLPPQTFCETLNAVDHPLGDPAWFAPDAIILGVKLADVAYGVDMKVVQSFTGALANEEVIRVWGDCGNLCRQYTAGLGIGDTVVWAVQNCDGAGNSGFCGGSLEQPQHYQLSACGVYWLHYLDGLVTGPITIAGMSESYSLGEFAHLVESCSPTGVSELADPAPPTVRYVDGRPILELRSSGAPVQLAVIDARGSAVMTRTWDGAPLHLTGLPPGAYTAQVSSSSHRRACRLVVLR